MNKFEWQKALRGAGLTPVEYMVLTMLSTYASADLTNARPGWNKLEDDTGLDPRTIKNAMKRLEAKGFVILTERKAVRGRANVYTVAIPSTASGTASSTASPGYSPPSSPGYSQSPSESAEPRGESPEDLYPESPWGDPWALPDKSHDPGLTDPWGTSVASRGTSVALQGVHPVPPHQVPTPDPEDHERHAPDKRRGADDDNWQHDLEPLSSTWKPWPHQIERATTLGLDIDEVLTEFIAFHYCTCSRAEDSTSWGAKFTAFIDAFPDERYEIEFRDHRAQHVDQPCPDCHVDLMWNWEGHWDYICPDCNEGYNARSLN